MRLQRLEITGFKSFCDRSELSFDRGVTAIVGPNGCGKSNVADAIVWVLGEQSAKSLRGDRMEDVIFSGSDARKPNAAAEVRLMLAGVPVSVQPASRARPGELVDDEGRPMVREVEVTRRLYRSGESEYLINGEVCRLRDVHELLMDTGLGAKAYAIIEQGKIGMILSSRPTDRRQLIEEAAGVTKYKARRRTAELKLEAAQQNLTRIDDIVFEVEKQRGTLKRQAAKARRYQRLRDELRRWEKVLFARRQRVLAQAIATRRGAHRPGARARKRPPRRAWPSSRPTLERVRLEMARRESDGREKREAAHAHEVEIGRLDQRIQGDEAAAGRARRGARPTSAARSRRSRPAAGRRPRNWPRSSARPPSRRRSATARRRRSPPPTRRRPPCRRTLDGLEADVEAVRARAVRRGQRGHRAPARHRERRQRARPRVARPRAVVGRGRRSRGRGRARAGRTARPRRRPLDARPRAAGRRLRDRAAREAEVAALRGERDRLALTLREHEQDLAERRRPADVARGVRGRQDGLRRCRAAGAVRVGRRRAAGRVGGRLPRGRRPATSAPSRRASATCCSTWWCRATTKRPRGLAFVRERDAGRCGFVVAGSQARGRRLRRARRRCPG